MRAYIDESGNTGFNLFDSAQPNFLNVSMASKVDFDDVFRERVQRIARIADVEYLHGSEMGVDGVEAIARDVIELVEFSEVRFYFAAVNKPDVAAMKFFDAVFDPGENPAAPRHSYGLRSLKFALLMSFVSITDWMDVRLFWDSMTSNRSPGAESQATKAIDNTLQRVTGLSDPRARQLIGDTLSWARDNLGKLSIWTPRKQDRYGHLPNLFTFPALLDSISETAKLWNSEVDLIVHDQQSQFGQTLKEWHSLFEGQTEPERIFHFGDTPIRFADIRNSQFEMGDSKKSAGLQVVDIVLWTFSRFLSDKPFGQMSKALFETCFSPDDLYMMSLGSIVAELEYTMDVVLSRPLSEDQILDGMKFVEYVEQLRQKSIKEDLENQRKAPR